MPDIVWYHSRNALSLASFRNYIEEMSFLLPYYLVTESGVPISLELSWFSESNKVLKRSPLLALNCPLSRCWFLEPHYPNTCESRLFFLLFIGFILHSFCSRQTLLFYFYFSWVNFYIKSFAKNEINNWKVQVKELILGVFYRVFCNIITSNHIPRIINDR